MAAACVVDHPCVAECTTPRPGTAVSHAVDEVLEAVISACRPSTSSWERVASASDGDTAAAVEARPATARAIDDVLFSIVDDAVCPTTACTPCRPSTAILHTVQLHPDDASPLVHPGDITLALASCDSAQPTAQCNEGSNDSGVHAQEGMWRARETGGVVTGGWVCIPGGPTRHILFHVKHHA